MNILIIGSGGREHAFAWKIKQSPLCKKLFIAPGNTGTQLFGANLPIEISDFENLAASSVQNNIDLILVGPEEPLVKGITDYFQENELTKHIKIVGPSKEASKLEGSKAFAKTFMQRHGIPTAGYKEFTVDNYTEGIDYITQHSYPLVLKADGLAAGKGVLICNSLLEARAEFELMLLGSKFGDAGKKIIVEDFLTGIEMSIFVLTDGVNYLLLPEAKDYKRIGKADTGLNTGGMGAISPVPILTEDLRKTIIEKVIEPTIKGLQKDKLDYKGFVFVGLMIENNEPMVIEYNCRMGDPETEVVLPRLKNDLLALLVATTDGTLNNNTIETDDRSAVGIVAVSGGYPNYYKTGFAIKGLSTGLLPESLLFHAGTTQKGEDIVTNGGRVLVAVSFGENIREAAEHADYLLHQVHFTDMNYRNDIGYEFM
ncbi:MAG: phosphoribosylamine--glycine ligase [Ferruginibacter sp.]